MIDDAQRQAASDLLSYIGQSPSPWHAVTSTCARLERAGFEPLDEAEAWRIEPGRAYYVVRDGSSIIAFRTGRGSLAEHGVRVIGAHTDSPGFRVKPNAAHERGNLQRVAVEIYGGPIIPTFADRDLTLAGRVLLKGDNGIQSRLVHFRKPLLRLPTPAIHLNREVNTQGLRFEAQDELPLLLSADQIGLPAAEHFRALLAEQCDVEPADIGSWELAVADTQPGAFFGANDEFIASPQLDNLASCHAGLEALLSADDPQGLTMCAFFDHEEVGSQSFKGADGTFLSDVLERVFAGLGADDETRRRALARGMVFSVDMAHAWHPNFTRYYDDEHRVYVNHGPVIKLNAKQRYSTDGVGEAFAAALAERVNVPIQKYIHRNNLPCGSTIGPITAGRLGIRSVDLGNAMWSMHSLRESAGAADQKMMIDLLTAFFKDWRAVSA